jgi:excisionase family DNA binding protein
VVSGFQQSFHGNGYDKARPTAAMTKMTTYRSAMNATERFCARISLAIVRAWASRPSATHTTNIFRKRPVIRARRNNSRVLLPWKFGDAVEQVLISGDRHELERRSMKTAQTIQTEERRAYSVREFCQAYRVSHSHVYALFKSGRLRSVRVGGKRLIPVEAAAELMNGSAQ